MTTAFDADVKLVRLLQENGVAQIDSQIRNIMNIMKVDRVSMKTGEV